MTMARWLGLLYAFYGCISVLVLALLTPPFQNADEPAHFVRADQISHGGLLARTDINAPALIDSGILRGAEVFSPVSTPLRVHVGRSMYTPVPWGPRIQAAYPSSAIYPPVFYLPAAAAIAVALRRGLTVLPALELARGLTGLASITVGAVAIALSGPGSIWLFCLLTLPMALAQAAAISQDGPLIACCALAAALFWQSGRIGGQARGWTLGGACLLIALAGQARPPYLALAFLPLAVFGFSRAVRGSAVMLICAAIMGWCWVTVSVSHIDVGRFNGSDAQAQAMGLLMAPWRLPALLARTIDVSGWVLAAQFVGQLGWLDVVLPDSYMRVAWCVLLAAVCGTIFAGRGWWRGWRVALAAGCILSAAIGMFIIQYLTWTHVGAGMIEGMQGRYFLPLAAMFPLIFARRGMGDVTAWRGRVVLPIVAVVALFPMVTIAVTVHQMLLRYYL